MPRRKKKDGVRWNRKGGALYKLKLMLGIPTTGQDRRGFAAEDKAEKALGYFKKKRLIARYIRTVHFSPDDLDWKDFIVTLLTEDDIAINVKNHRWSWQEEKAYREKGILLVTIWESDTDEIAQEKILNLIMCAYLSRLRLDHTRLLVLETLKERIDPPKGLAKRLRTCLKKAGPSATPSARQTR